MNLKQLGLVIAYFLLPLPLIIAFYYETFAEYRTVPSMVLSVFGIIAFVWFCFEFILMARPKFLDQTFGMDKIQLFHIGNSIVMLILSGAHAALEEMREEGNEIQTHIGSGALGIYFLLVLLAFLFMITTFLDRISIYSKIKKLVMNLFKIRYHISKLVHNLTIVATFVLYVHISLASTSRHSIVLELLYSLYFFTGLFVWLYHKFVRPILIKKTVYTVTSVIQETWDIWTLKLVPASAKKIAFRAGQYCYLTIDAPNFSKEPHPFSFSSSALEKEEIAITIKELGDYTRNIRNVPVGAKAYLDGPYGILTLDQIRNGDSELVMIAGGVGITPFLSQLAELRATNPNRKVTFIYGIRTPKDLIRPQEFERYQKEMPNLKIIPVVSDDNSWPGECGFIDQPRLEHLAACEAIDPHKQHKYYFICGPPLMLSMVLKSLKAMHVDPHLIHVEQFS